MTNQNVVLIPEEQQAAMKMVASKKKLNMTNGGAKISSWVDSMRASSPPRISISPSLTEEEKSWAVSIHIYITNITILFKTSFELSMYESDFFFFNLAVYLC